MHSIKDLTMAIEHSSTSTCLRSQAHNPLLEATLVLLLSAVTEMDPRLEQKAVLLTDPGNHSTSHARLSTKGLVVEGPLRFLRLLPTTDAYTILKVIGTRLVRRESAPPVRIHHGSTQLPS